MMHTRKSIGTKCYKGDDVNHGNTAKQQTNVNERIIANQLDNGMMITRQIRNIAKEGNGTQKGNKEHKDCIVE